MTHYTASGTSRAVSHKIKIFILKKCSKSILYGEIFVSRRQTDIQASNSGYSLYSSGSGDVQELASTKNGKDKFNIVHVQYTIPTGCTFGLHFLATFVAPYSVDMCSVNVFGNSLQILLKL